ncbi:hypothetical protein LTR17_021314 [Elasticomyces elasticus]|nr:hypothetical protein LTR17_021314 [Elasticomyces elasticus]
MEHLKHILRQLCGPTSQKRLADIELISKHDTRQIWRRNKIVPQSFDFCTHDLIADTAQKTPRCTGDRLSTTLAYALVEAGVGPEVIVPLCFEKSMWTVVAMLGVMKAGGTSLALGTTLPEPRLRSVLETTKPSLIVASVSCQQLATRLLYTMDGQVILIGASHVADMRAPSQSNLPLVRPSNSLYVVYTSGTTGVPKEVILTHANLSSAIHHQKDIYGYRSSSRVYDFASYAFDVAWSNVLYTLVCGGVLCIPSEHERRHNLADSINAFETTLVTLTPSVARILLTDTLKRLTKLIVGGESLSAPCARAWCRLVNLIIAYGPAECSVSSNVHKIEANATAVALGSIGHSYGANTWVVQTMNGVRLAPLSCGGEL